MVNGTVLNNTLAGYTSRSKLSSLLRIHISPDRIHFLKFILEGYDGLAILSTIDARQGIVEIRYALESEKDLKELLDSIGPQIDKSTA